MAQVDSKEFQRRQPFFRARNYDPAEVKLTLPDVTFDHGMTIRPRNREIHLAYSGPGHIKPIVLPIA